MNILIGDKSFECDSNGMILKQNGGIYKQTPDKDGYLRYHIRDYETKITFNISVHKVVWIYFNGLIPEGMTVDHIDDVKTNNHISNLQLLSAIDNAIKGNARHWRLFSPAGEELVIYNLEQFGRENNLHAGHLREVALGKLKSYKGWTK